MAQKADHDGPANVNSVQIEREALNPSRWAGVKGIESVLQFTCARVGKARKCCFDLG